MKITEVSYEEARKCPNNPNLYRVSICDDGTKGRTHWAARLKAVKRLTFEEFAECKNNPAYGFIIISDYTNETV